MVKESTQNGDAGGLLMAPYCGNADPLSNGSGVNKKVSLNGNVALSPVQSMAQLVPPVYRPLIQRMRDRIERNEPFFSLEFFPPRTMNGLANFYTRLDRLAEGGPLFIDVTWHMGSDPGSDKETSSSSVAAACLNYCLVDTMLHVTCAQYTKEQTMLHLKKAKELGLRNLLALRGDLAPTQDNSSSLDKIKYKALDLVKWIREEYGDYFTIAVAGYPLGHPDAKSYADDLDNLKAKCDAGADFVITQLFFEVDSFEKFVRDCRLIGIKVPIVPGIMPIMVGAHVAFSYDNIKRIAQLSKLDLPQFVVEALEPIKGNDDAVRNYGIQLAVNICKQLLDNGTVPSVHVYTLNREGAAREILSRLGLWKKATIKSLPWKAQTETEHPLRCKEDVRPIFWASRPKSYVYRTKEWDEFPNGRWGNSSSPAFGDLADYHLFAKVAKESKEETLKMWGETLENEQQVWKVFEHYIAQTPNHNGVKVSCLPWSEVSMADETILLRDQLVWCNQRGIMTINSQPPVNGAPSTDPLVGWGNPGGYCYQKAYLEFFISRKHKAALLQVLPNYPGVNYHIIDRIGDGITNDETTDPNAVTWGVFPGSEVQQPTVVDPVSFQAWRDEAYGLWLSAWGKLYAEDSASRTLLQNMHDDCLLVNLVDNDFPLQCCLWRLLDEVLAVSDGRSE